MLFVIEILAEPDRRGNERVIERRAHTGPSVTTRPMLRRVVIKHAKANGARPSYRAPIADGFDLLSTYFGGALATFQAASSAARSSNGQFSSPQWVRYKTMGWPTLSVKHQRERNQMLNSRTLTVPIAAAIVFVSMLLSAPAFAQAHIRGTLTAVKDGTIDVETSKGGTQSIKLANDAGLFLVTTADMSVIQSGKFVGITSIEQDGKRVAREVHVFDESLRGLAEGHYPWDLDAKPNMMTNANIAKIDEVGTDRVVKLNYDRGEQTVTIPTNATVVSFNKAPADQLAVGRKVFIVMTKDGSQAAAVVIGAEGIKPPM